MSNAYFDEFIDPLLPAKRAFVIRIEHLGRYLFAKRFLSKKKVNLVYDVGCGDGYGTKILSKTCTRVVGFDGNQSHIQYAKNKNASENVSYILIDLEKTSLLTTITQISRPRAIICFETIEHIDSGDRLLHDFFELLPKGGILLLSTPNAKLEPKKQGKSKNIYHKKIYYEKELQSVLQRNGFYIFGIYGQPLTNIVLHNAKWFVALCNRWTENSTLLIYIFSYILAFPIKILRRKSYAQIIAAIKK